MRGSNYSDAEDYYDLALAWIENREYEKAADCLSHVIELNPNFIYAYITRAEEYAREGRYADAVHILRHASKIDPGFDRLNFLMAGYALEGGDFKTAHKQIERAIMLVPDPAYMALQEDIIRAHKGTGRGK